MLLNLISNAVKFTDQGGTIRVAANLNEAGELILSVSDTGMGIAPEDLGKVLMPFGQADDGLDRQNEGTGLGLPLTKAMAEMHAARFDITSVVDEGTVVSLTFPSIRIVPLPAHAA